MTMDFFRCCTWNSPWSKSQRILRVFGIALFIADIVFDLQLALDYLSRDMHVYFWWTLGLVIGPAVITSGFSLYWECNAVKIRQERERQRAEEAACEAESADLGETEVDGGRVSEGTFPKWLCFVESFLGPLSEPVTRLSCQAFLWHCLLLGTLFRSLRALFTQRRPNGEEDGLMEIREASFLQLIESFLEAAPQVVLQIGIMVMNNSASTKQLLSVTASPFSLALSIKTYFAALREVNSRLAAPLHQYKLSYKGGIMMILWRLGMISSRAVAMAVFLAAYGVWLVLIAGIHCLVMFLWHIHQKTLFTFPKGLDYTGLTEHGEKWKILLKEWCFDFVMAGLTVFCFINLLPGNTFYRMTAYYIVMLIENTIMTALWFSSLHSDERVWHTYLILAIVWGSFLFGTIWLLIYYQYGHPNKEDQEPNVVEKFVHHVLVKLQKDVLIRQAQLDSHQRETYV